MKRNNKILIVTISFVLIIAVVLCVRMISFKQTYDNNQDKIAELQTKLEAQQQRTEELKDFKETISSDEFVESEARDKFNLYYEGEVIFKPSNTR